MAIDHQDGNNDDDIERFNSIESRKSSKRASAQWILLKLWSRKIAESMKKHKAYDFQYYSSLALASEITNELKKLKGWKPLTSDCCFQLLEVTSGPTPEDTKMVVETRELKVANNYTVDKEYLKAKIIFSGDFAAVVQNVLKPKDCILIYGGRVTIQENGKVILANCSRESSCIMIIIPNDSFLDTIDDTVIEIPMEWMNKVTMTTITEPDVHKVIKVTPKLVGDRNSVSDGDESGDENLLESSPRPTSSKYVKIGRAQHNNTACNSSSPGMREIIPVDAHNIEVMDEDRNPIVPQSESVIPAANDSPQNPGSVINLLMTQDHVTQKDHENNIDRNNLLNSNSNGNVVGTSTSGQMSENITRRKLLNPKNRKQQNNENNVGNKKMNCKIINNLGSLQIEDRHFNSMEIETTSDLNPQQFSEKAIDPSTNESPSVQNDDIKNMLASQNLFSQRNRESFELEQLAKSPEENRSNAKGVRITRSTRSSSGSNSGTSQNIAFVQNDDAIKNMLPSQNFFSQRNSESLIDLKQLFKIPEENRSNAKGGRITRSTRSGSGNNSVTNQNIAFKNYVNEAEANKDDSGHDSLPLQAHSLTLMNESELRIKFNLKKVKICLKRLDSNDISAACTKVNKVKRGR